MPEACRRLGHACVGHTHDCLRLLMQSSSTHFGCPATHEPHVTFGHTQGPALCVVTHTQNSMLMRTYHEVHSTLHNSVCVRALGGPHTCIMIVVLRPARNCHSHNPSDTNPSATPHNCHPPPDTRALLCACAAVGSCASVQMCTRARARLFWHWAHICIAVFVHLF